MKENNPQGEQKPREVAVKPQEMKLGEYFLHVFVEDVCRLDVGDGDATAAVQVTAFDSVKLTDKREGITSESTVYFGDHFYFVRSFDDRELLEDATLTLTVFKKGLMSSQMIGSISLNISAVYFEPNHTIRHRWYVLQDKEKDFDKPKGFLKISMNLAADSDEKSELKPESMESSLDAAKFDLPPSIKLRFSQLRLRILRGVNLPKVESGSGIDAYLEVSFAGMTLKTKTVSNLNPTWLDDLLLPLADPSFLNTIKMQLFDYNSVMKNVLVGSLALDINAIKKEKLKKVGWVHLYGPSNDASSEVSRMMLEFPSKGRHLLPSEPVPRKCSDERRDPA